MGKKNFELGNDKMCIGTHIEGGKLGREGGLELVRKGGLELGKDPAIAYVSERRNLQGTGSQDKRPFYWNQMVARIATKCQR